MGSLVSSIIVKEPADFRLLEALPKSIGFRVYSHSRAKVYPIDLYAARRGAGFPFSSYAPGIDYPSGFPEEASLLTPFHDALRRGNRSDCVRPVLLHLCNHVSTLLKQKALGLLGDDDGVDFSCHSEEGRVRKILAVCGGALLHYEHEKGAWLQMFLEDEESEERPPAAGLRFDEAAIERPQLIHHYCIQAVREFSGADPILGLGEFDALDDEENWILQYDSKRK